MSALASPPHKWCQHIVAWMCKNVHYFRKDNYISMLFLFAWQLMTKLQLQVSLVSLSFLLLPLSHLLVDTHTLGQKNGCPCGNIFEVYILCSLSY